MNKAYKVVFNKVRGTMMVVNEVTSSIQKKGTKTVLSAALIGGLSVCGASPVWADTTLSGTHVIENTSESQSSYLDSAHHWIGGALTLEDGSDVTIKSNGNGLINVSGSKASLTLSAVNTGDTNGIYMNGLNGSVGEANFVLDKLNVGNAYTGSQLIIGIGIYVAGDNSVNISAKDLTINSAGDGVQVTPSQDSVKGLNVTGLDNLEINAGQGSAKDGMAVTMTYGRVSFESKEGSQGTFLFQSNEDNRYETHGVINNRGSGTLIVKNDAGTNQIIGPNMTGVYLNYREVGLEGGTLSVSGAQNIIQASAAVRADMPEGKLFLTATTGDNTIIGSKSGIAVIEGAAQVKAENGCNVITAAENKGVALQAGGNHLSKIASRQPGSGTLTVIGKTNIINGRVLAETSGSQIDIFGDTSVVYDHAAVNDEANAAVDARNGGRIGLGQGSDRVLVQNLGSLDRDGEKVNIGILARLSPSVVDVKGNELTVSVNAKGNDWAYGVHAQNNSQPSDNATSFATLNFNSAKTIINVSGKGHAIGAMSQGIVNVNGDLEVTTADGANAITARGYAKVNINASRENTVKLSGDVAFDYDAATSGTTVNADVNVNLTNDQSYWTGRSYISGNPPEGLNQVENFNLLLANGGTWNATDSSFVNSLTLEKGGVVNATGGSDKEIRIDKLTASGSESSIKGGKSTAIHVSELSVAEGGSLNVNGKFDVTNGVNKGTLIFSGGEFTGYLNTTPVVGGEDLETPEGAVVIDGDFINRGAISAESLTLKSGTFTHDDTDGLHASEYVKAYYFNGGEFIDMNSQEEDPDTLVFDGENANYLAGTKLFYSNAEVEKAMISKMDVQAGSVHILADYSGHFTDVKVSGGLLAVGDNNTDPAAVGKLDLETYTQRGGTATVGAGSHLTVTGEMNVSGGSLSNSGTINVKAMTISDSAIVSVSDGSLTVDTLKSNGSGVSVGENGALTIQGDSDALVTNKGNVTLTGGVFSGKVNLYENEAQIFDGAVVIAGDVTNKGNINAESFTLESGIFTDYSDIYLHANAFNWNGGEFIDMRSRDDDPDAATLLFDYPYDVHQLAGTEFFYSKDGKKARMTGMEVEDGLVRVLADYSDHFDSLTVSGGNLTLGAKADSDSLGKFNVQTFAQSGGSMVIHAGSSLTVTGKMNVSAGELLNLGTIDVSKATEKLALNGVVLEESGTLKAMSGQFFGAALDAEGKVTDATSLDLAGLTAQGGSLALDDDKYTLDYVKSASELLTKENFGGQLVMLGDLINAAESQGKVTIDQINDYAGGAILSQVTGTTGDKDLVIGSSSDEGSASTSNSLGMANIDLGTASKVTVNSDKTLTLVGKGGNLVSSSADSTTIDLEQGNLVIGGSGTGTQGGTLSSTVSVGAGSSVNVTSDNTEAKFELNEIKLTDSSSKLNVEKTTETKISSISMTAAGTVDITDNKSVSIGTLVADAGQLNVSGTNAQIGQVELNGNALLSVAEKSQAVIDKISGQGTLTVGNNESAGKLTINNASAHSGVIFVDPAWSDDASLNVVENASGLEIYTRESNQIGSQIIVGTNSIVALGSSADEAISAFNSLKDIQGVSWRDVGAALYVGAPVTVTGGILVKAGAAATDTVTAGTVSIENGSMLIVNADAGRSGPAITGTVAFGDNSRFGLTNADAGNFTLATAVTGTDNVTVLTDNPFITADLEGNGTIVAQVSADNGLGALASIGIQAMTRRADFMLAQTIADRTSIDQEMGAGLNLWVDVSGENYESDSLDNGGSFKADVGYGAFGADVAINETMTAGAAIQYGSGSLRSSVSKIKNSIDNYGITAYGAMKFGDAKLVGELAYVKSENDITSSQAALNQKVDADIYSAGLRAQYRLTAGQFEFVPSIGLRVSRLETDAMQVGQVNVDKQKQTLVQTPIALRINGSEMGVSGWDLAPSFKIAYVPTFGDKEIEVLGAKQDVIDTAPVQMDMGLRAQNGNLMINANFMLGSGKDGTSSVGGKIGMKYIF